MCAEPFDLDVADRLEAMIHALRAGRVHAVNVTTFIAHAPDSSTMTVHLIDAVGENVIGVEPREQPMATRLYGGG